MKATWGYNGCRTQTQYILVCVIDSKYTTDTAPRGSFEFTYPSLKPGQSFVFMPQPYSQILALHLILRLTFWRNSDEPK